MIAANLKLTEAEAAKFWPIYDQYTQELVGINDKRYDLIKQYSQNWGSTWIQQLRSCAPSTSRSCEGCCRAKRPPLFFQLHRRISMMIDRQISSQLPLVQSQE